MANIKELLEEILRNVKPQALIAVTVSRAVAAAGDYAAEDVVADNATTGITWDFPVPGQSGTIEQMEITCSVTGLTPRLTLQLYSQLPASALADNAANTGCLQTDRSFYEGYIDAPAMRDLGTGISESLSTPNTPASNLPLRFVSQNRVLRGILITRDAITGESANMIISVTLYIRPD